MWTIASEHIRGVLMLAMGLTSLLAMVDRWLLAIPVGEIGFVVLFYVGIGSGIQIVREVSTSCGQNRTEVAVAPATAAGGLDSRFDSNLGE
jgi:hypothetical protein